MSNTIKDEGGVFVIEMSNPTDESLDGLTEVMNEWQNEMVAYTQKEAEKLGLTYGQAADILYLRTRSRWTQEEEDRMIEEFRKEN